MYVINLDDKKVKEHNVTYFDSFGIEDIPQEVLNKTKDKSFPHLECNLMILSCADFIALRGYKHLFSLNEY